MPASRPTGIITRKHLVIGLKKLHKMAILLRCTRLHVPTAAFPNWVQDIPRQKFKQLCPISSERLSKVMHRLHVCLA